MIFDDYSPNKKPTNCLFAGFYMKLRLIQRRERLRDSPK